MATITLTELFAPRSPVRLGGRELLWISDGGLLATANADATGTVVFDGLQPGRYVVQGQGPDGQLVTQRPVAA